MLAFALLLFCQLTFAAQTYSIVSHSISIAPSGLETETRLDGYDVNGKARMTVFHTRVLLYPNPNRDYYSFTFLDPDNRTSRATVLNEDEYRKLVKDLKTSPVNSMVNNAMSWISNGCVVTVVLGHGPLFISSNSTCPPK